MKFLGYGYEPSGSTQGGQFHDQLKSCEAFKSDL